MPIKDFIEKYTHGDDFDWDAFKAAAIAEADKDDGAATAKITTLTDRVGVLEKEATHHKSELWDLMKKVPAETKTPVEQQQATDEDARTMDDLFGKKE